MKVGESAGPECKAALQETTKLIEQRLTTNARKLKTLFNAAEVCSASFLHVLTHDSHAPPNFY